jgi:cytidine deaminase
MSSKKINITTSYLVYESIHSMDETCQMLMKKAVEASKSAYAPYSNFYVGAALLLENGDVLTGNNQENIAYPSGLCAERVALFNAGAHFPKIAIKTIAITAMSTKFLVNHPVAPCGACRQVMSEYENKQGKKIKVLMMGEKGEVNVIESVNDLLPLMFNELGLKSIK